MKQQSDLIIDGPGGALPLRIHYPRADHPLPTLIFLHGGGWVLGNLDTHDRIMRQLAADSGFAIAGVDYRLAPEHRFPAANEDSLAAVEWIAENGADLGLDTARLAIGGDSAGAALSLSTLMTLRDQGRDILNAGLLYYGAFGLRDSRSRRLYGGEEDGLSRENLAFFRKSLLGPGRPPDDWRLNMLDRPVAGLPPLFIGPIEMDPLRDDSDALSELCVDAAVDHQEADHRLREKLEVHGRETLSPGAAAVKPRVAYGILFPVVSRRFFGASAICWGLAACSPPPPNPTGRYLGQEPPGTTAERFAPGVVSTEAHEVLFGFFEDGTRLFAERTPRDFEHDWIQAPVLHAELQDGTWTKLEPTASTGAPWYVHYPAAPEGTRVAFPWRSRLDPNATRVFLEVDGQTMEYAHGPPLPTAMKWPGPGAAVSRITLAPQVAGQNTISVSGPWSFFRLLDEGSIQRSSLNDRFTVTFNVGGRLATFDLRANSVFNPFTLTALGQFRCPQL